MSDELPEDVAARDAQLLADHVRAAAQRLIDDLDDIRRLALAQGLGSQPVQLVRARPARDPRAPRPKTRTARNAEHLGHVAAVETMTLAQLLNLLTPGGPPGPDHRLYLVDPPAEGTRVDPQARAR